MRKQTITYYIVLLFVFVGIVFLLIQTRPTPEAKLQEVTPVSVRVVDLVRETLIPGEDVTGRLQPSKRARLRFEVAGQVAQRYVEPGLRVKAGAVLLILAEGDFKDTYAEVNAQYEMERVGIARDRRLLDLARKNRSLQAGEVERLEKLGRQSLSSRSNLDAARQTFLQLEAEVFRLDYAVTTAEARLAMKKSMRDRAARDLQRTQLKAPFAGKVNEVTVDVGDYVSPSQSVLTLVDTDQLDVYLEVRGDVAANLTLSEHIPVSVNGEIRSGELVALQPDPDPSTNTHALRIRIQGNHARPGMLASAQLSLAAQANVLTVPETAILTLDGKTYVFRYHEGRVQRVVVVLGPRVGEKRVLRQGVTEGDRVVARDVAALGDGQRVIAQPLTDS